MTKPPELNLDADKKAIVAQLMETHGFDSLKNTQAFAFNQGILDENNHLTVAPTGNGKTLTAEAVVKQHLDQGDRVAYLVPSTQLVWAKRDTINEWVGHQHRVKTGDNKYREGDVVIATFESYYQAMIRGVDGARELDAVVLDDFHELYSQFRGREIELSIAAAIGNCKIYGISATIRDADEVANWMNGEAHISPEGRQTPIEETAVETGSSSTKEQIIDVIDKNRDKGPFLVFCFAKSWTESRSEAVAESDLFDGPEKQEVRSEIADRVDGVLTNTHKQIIEIISSGAAYVHSDLPGSIKQYIIELYETEQIQAIMTTTSLAYGFDSPVQSVIIADEKRRGEWIQVFEYIQMAGRAARPKYDYDKGYCYTLTNDTDEAEDRFFKPDRDLERIKTHIDDNEAFRWMVLELIENGWQTDTDLIEFISRTLYYEQLDMTMTMGQPPTPKDEQVKERLDKATDWLIDKEFITQSETWGDYSTTNLGQGAVEFQFNSWIDASLTSVRQFFNWAEAADGDSLKQIDYLHRVVKTFDTTLNEKAVDNVTESVIRDYGFDADEAGITAGIVRWYWMANASLDEIEQKSGIDPVYLPNLASEISRTVKATTHLVEASPEAEHYEWLESLVHRTDKGINEDEVMIVSMVDNVGRSRVRSLRSYLQNIAQNRMQVAPSAPINELLQSFYDFCGDDQRFVEMLTQQAAMIGEVTAKGIVSNLDNLSADGTRVATNEENALDERVSEMSDPDVDTAVEASHGLDITDF
jgi:replicative superfamily II helicase